MFWRPERNSVNDFLSGYMSIVFPRERTCLYWGSKGNERLMPYCWFKGNKQSFVQVRLIGAVFCSSQTNWRQNLLEESSVWTDLAINRFEPRTEEQTAPGSRASKTCVFGLWPDRVK